MSSDPPPPTKIFVGKLSDSATSDNLRPLFEAYGDVRECDVLSGYGFVHMATGEEADRAIANLDGCEFMGSNICVEKSTGRKKAGGPRGGGGGGPMRGRGGGRGGGFRDRGRGGGGYRGGGGDRNNEYTPYDRNGYDRKPQSSYNRNGYDGGYDRHPPPAPGGRDYPPRDDGYRPPPPRAADPYAADPYPAARDPYPAARDPYPPAARDPYPPAARDPYPPAARDPYASADPYAAPEPSSYYSTPSASGMYDRRSPQAAAAKAYADPYAQRNTGYEDRGYSTGYSTRGGGRPAPY